MTHDKIIADDLRDLKVNIDRQVSVGDDNDLRQTHGIETVQQSTILSVGNEIRPLIGDTVTPESLAEITSRIRRALRRDPQLDSVRRVDVETINKDNNTIEIEVFVGFNDSFTLDMVLP